MGYASEQAPVIGPQFYIGIILKPDIAPETCVGIAVTAVTEILQNGLHGTGKSYTGGIAGVAQLRIEEFFAVVITGRCQITQKKQHRRQN